MSRHDLDITERLRWDKRYTNGHVSVTLEDAAKEIERLRSIAHAKGESVGRPEDERKLIDEFRVLMKSCEYAAPGNYDDKLSRLRFFWNMTNSKTLLKILDGV